MAALTRLALGLDQGDVNIPKSTLTPTRIETGFLIFFGIAGAVAMLFVTIGAFQYTLSRGDPNAIKKSKETIIYAALGLIVALSGYGIVAFVLARI